MWNGERPDGHPTFLFPLWDLRILPGLVGLSRCLSLLGRARERCAQRRVARRRVPGGGVPEGGLPGGGVPEGGLPGGGVPEGGLPPVWRWGGREHVNVICITRHPQGDGSVCLRPKSL